MRGATDGRTDRRTDGRSVGVTVRTVFVLYPKMLITTASRLGLGLDELEAYIKTWPGLGFKF